MTEYRTVPVEPTPEMITAAHAGEVHTADVASAIRRAEVFQRRYKAALAAAPANELAECEWKFDEDVFDGEWQSGCGEVFQFNDAGPVENGCKFCMYCGGKVRVKE